MVLKRSERLRVSCAAPPFIQRRHPSEQAKSSGDVKELSTVCGGQGGTHRNARHLERQLLTKGIGKRLVAIGYDQEGTRAADDVGAIPLVDMGLIARGYGQAVHGDPMRDGGVPGTGRRHLTAILFSISRHVDHLSPGG